MSDNNFNATVESLFRGMDNFLTTKTVVGDAVKFDDGTIILPLVEVSFGVGAGAFAGDNKNNAGGGLGGKITPSSVLVIQNGTSKVVNVKEKDSISKLLDMVPDMINKFAGKNCKKNTDTDNTDNVDNLDEKIKETREEKSDDSFWY
ncbi:GerW family sporulation protein [Herbinix luporum]|jgi:uncharacterized spore protein YtfJ|uniref:Sporulation protein YtfJ n=1 Tax=Herbinix luporum TaxID=1679721 RepID=A0A0K8J6J6_9FIRM|nr:GerW family sporulation protein [Herbinix luporum]MDI9487790.1 GerW family sporulation protein [Bacillota bacterium]CUH93216.1 hypothetical protein SD1D_1671 [Herbinix luporum]HHT57931.1 sporulation protein [Herbinix luporum]